MKSYICSTLEGGGRIVISHSNWKAYDRVECDFLAGGGDGPSGFTYRLGHVDHVMCGFDFLFD